ncbi:MAG: DUF6816 family protein [Synechococcus sp. ELA057]
MNGQRSGAILPPVRRTGAGRIALLLALLLLPGLLLAAPAAALSGPGGPLQTRLEQWPAWRLPAPLPRPGDRAPAWPDWFAGEWQVQSTSLEATTDAGGRPDPPWRARFVADPGGRVVADRAFNADSLGQALLGDQLRDVRDDHRHPQRQLSRFQDGRLLETTLVGARTETIDADTVLNDELSLQVLHGAGEPQLSRLETLGRWHRRPDGGIDGEQWLARYPSPSDGLIAEAEPISRIRLRLDPLPPAPGPASGTAG